MDGMWGDVSRTCQAIFFSVFALGHMHSFIRVIWNSFNSQVQASLVLLPHRFDYSLRTSLHVGEGDLKPFSCLEGH